MFDDSSGHATADGILDSALATLRGRWGSAAIRLGSGVEASAATVRTHGSLALAPLPDPAVGSRPSDDRPSPAPLPAPFAGPDAAARAMLPVPILVAGGQLATDAAATVGRAPAFDPRPEVVSTGFPALDAILGQAGLPAEASAAFRGDLSSGKTTLALRCVAEAQAGGAIVAWLDLARAFDPREAVGRGVDLRWLLVIRPVDVTEGFGIAGALLSGRSVDLLVVDLPARSPDGLEGLVRLLSAHARRTRARLLVLEPTSIGASLHAALGEAAGLRLELERRSWLRLGRDVVGQRTEVTVIRDRHAAPGRRAALEIHYLVDGERALEAHRLAVHHLAAARTDERGVAAGGVAAGGVARAAGGGLAQAAGP